MLVAARGERDEARAHLRDAQQQLATATGREFAPSVAPQPYSPLLAVIIYYVSSIAAVAANSFTNATDFDPILLVVMAALLGIGIALRDPTPNVWSIAMYALAMPAVAFLLIVWRTDRAYLQSHAAELVRGAALLALSLAASAFATALVAIGVRHRDRLRAALRLPTLAAATGSTERVMKLVSGIVSAVTVVGGVVAALVNVLSR